MAFDLTTPSLSIRKKEYYRNIAEVHYGFIRIHPFPDGNGRIGRVLIDQLALCYGLPPAMRGYPRNEPHRRNEYHKAIYSCIDDPNYTLLAQWIQSYIEAQFAEIA
jgi:cell filamentation protein